jgi:hypothetical protein
MAALNWDAACVAAGVAKMDAIAFVNGPRGSCAPIERMDREQAAKLAVDGLRNQISQPLNGQSVGRPPRAGLKGPTSESFRARRVMKYIL